LEVRRSKGSQSHPGIIGSITFLLLTSVLLSSCAATGQGQRQGDFSVVNGNSLDSIVSGPRQFDRVVPFRDEGPLLYVDPPAFDAAPKPYIPVTRVSGSPRSEGSIANGYRIQLYSGSDKSAARRFENTAMSTIAHPVYLTYEAPQYKVRIGNFVSRDEALILCDQLKKTGFPEAWVVRSTIKLGQH
jgi:hypothetical protein